MTEMQPPAGTVVPRWTIAGAAPEPGFAQQRAALGTELASALCRRADELGVDLDVVLFAAHLKVLGALTSERSLVTGRLTDAGLTAHRATLDDGTWRELVTEAARALTEQVPGAPETVADQRPTPAARPTAAYAVHYDADLVLTLTYRRDVMTADHAERVAGYYVTALRLLTGDVDAAHHEQSLLSQREMDFQLTGLCGPRRPLPGPLFVELFEQQARARPDETAAAHRDQRWTYRELDQRANRIAHSLLARGLGDEDVVAVVMDRNLDWLAATLGVLKAGGVYLPVRPDFPAGRVASQLETSDCRHAVTEPGSEEVLHAAVARTGRQCHTVLVADAYRTPRTDTPGRTVRPEQLAYIYFTSGSTGSPKGAMCEHEGMLNHLYAKVDDMELRAGDVVTQTASQCFDISLWQLLAPLLVGGSTLIVDTDTQLDVDRFVGLVAAGGVQVIQIVPAYLDVMLANLESGNRPLGDLRSVSVTGEALKVSLVKRWFALYPDIRLVNAYGATEVSDDTMHAVLDRVPERDLAVVNVGHSLRNVTTYILDERLRAVPLGAPGEIAFSGVCVGRGYINDPERTAQAFTDDPYRAGTRLYRTGDYGRWLPEGTIEFLGRRDEQVKVRGYRIEIGEIENRLLQMPGVTKAAVVIAGAGEGDKNLVAFHTGATDLEPADLRDFLAATLPEYMVPSYFHRLDALPLTENGKTDKKFLTSLAAELGQDVAAYSPPATDTERRLATAWAEVLNVLVGKIGRDDDFFRLGGTSLGAVRLVVRLQRQISLRDLLANPVLRDLAAAIDGVTIGPADRAGVLSPSPDDPLLQQVSAAGGTAEATLVCFPYAGGNAVNFRLLAQELASEPIAVHAVELPGHDIGRPGEPLADVAEIARRVLRELPDGPLILWGHCAGGAYAVELARLLEAEGRPAERLFIGALLLEDPAELLRESTEVTALSNRQITARLQGDRAYVELDMLKSERSELVSRAYRHDVCSTNTYLRALQEDPRPPRLTTRVEVVVAADDPTTRDPQQRYKLWEQAAASVALHTLDEGGHYFTRTRAADVAALVAARRAQT